VHLSKVENTQIRKSVRFPEYLINQLVCIQRYSTTFQEMTLTLNQLLFEAVWPSSWFSIISSGSVIYADLDCLKTVHYGSLCCDCVRSVYISC
jgi:hypothetical protein